MPRRLLVSLCIVALVISVVGEDNWNGKRRGNGGGNDSEAGGGRKKDAPNATKTGGASQKKIVMSANGFNIEANGNGAAPFFKYWTDSNPTSRQKVMFMKMWQTDTPSAPANRTRRSSQVQLAAAYDWTFSEAVDGSDGIVSMTNFTITGTPKDSGKKDSPKPIIVLNNHLISNVNTTEFKFDINITGFQSDWWDQSAKALVLGLQIVVSSSESDDGSNVSLAQVRQRKNADRPNKPAGGGSKADVVDFGNGNAFEAVSIATAGSTPVAVSTSLTVEDGKSFVMLTYDKFDTNLLHDPTLLSTPDSTFFSTGNVIQYTASGDQVDKAVTGSSSALRSVSLYIVSLVAIVWPALCIAGL